MNVLEVVKKRRSIRAFLDKKIPPLVIEKLKEALIWAPSAGNLQSRKFYFVYNPRIKEKLAQAALGQSFIAEAPLVIVGCTDEKITWRYGQRGKDLYSICDVACSIENMFLVATEEGLGSVWVGAFDEEGLREILNIPDTLHPIVICPVGYPDEEPIAPPRVSKDRAIGEIK